MEFEDKDKNSPKNESDDEKDGVWEQEEFHKGAEEKKNSGFRGRTTGPKR